MEGSLLPCELSNAIKEDNFKIAYSTLYLFSGRKQCRELCHEGQKPFETYSRLVHICTLLIITVLFVTTENVKATLVKWSCSAGCGVFTLNVEGPRIFCGGTLHLPLFPATTCVFAFAGVTGFPGTTANTVPLEELPSWPAVGTKRCLHFHCFVHLKPGGPVTQPRLPSWTQVGLDTAVGDSTPGALLSQILH